MRPDLFRQAASRIVEGFSDYACNALVLAHYLETDGSVPFDHAGLLRELPEVNFFRAVLDPRDRGNVFYQAKSGHFNEREARALGLLLCAELVEDGLTLRDFAWGDEIEVDTLPNAA